MQSLSSGQTISSDDGRNPYRKREVYALFRVYGLKSGHVGVKIYIDPEAARKDGLLEFEAQSWSVTPKMKSVNQTQAQTQTQTQAEVQSQAGMMATAAADNLWSFKNLDIPAF